MAILTLDETKNWLLDTPAADDPVITMLIAAAEAYLYNATGVTFNADNYLAKVFCLTLVTDWYENRGMIGKTTERTRPVINGILTQLSNCAPPPTEVSAS